MSDIDVMLAILKVTKFENRHYNFAEELYDKDKDYGYRHKGYSDNNPELVKLLEDHGYEPNIYICISPKITVKRIEYPKGHKDKDLDMRLLRLGHPKCDHKHLPLYWETGGGMMDTGTPHNYAMCMYCGHHPSKLNWFQKLLKRYHYVGPRH